MTKEVTVAQRISDAGTALARARLDLAPLPGLGALAPGTAAEAYQVQERLVAALGDTLGIAIGYKIGATSEKAQVFLKCDGPFHGRILSGACFESPARLPAGDFNNRLIESEIAFMMGAALPPRDADYSREEVGAAVAAAFPAFEIAASGMAAWNTRGIFSIIADNGAHGAFVAGAALPDWRDHDLATLEVTFYKNGKNLGAGTGANALGHPLAALTWLANDLARRGTGLKAGQVITTGAVAPFSDAGAGDKLEADFGAFGKIKLEFF